MYKHFNKSIFFRNSPKIIFLYIKNLQIMIKIIYKAFKRQLIVLMLELKTIIKIFEQKLILKKH
jgi:hypothetical protein